ncbi:MAG: DUF2384 domain-containing protein [Planctomycetes bacterium]|nr:DUF2384 domain-containing protein [Planctomycetota bacterium]
MMGECWDFAPHAGAILTSLLHGLTDPEKLIRLSAIKGLMHAFPIAETPLSHLLDDILSDEPKVRLAAIEQIIKILPNILVSSSGLGADSLAPPGKQPGPVTEDFMDYAGRWVAWTRDRQRVLAVADSFTDVLKQAQAAGEPDPYIKKAPGVSPAAVPKALALLEGESPNILDDIHELFPDPEAWLDAPNSWLGGDKPRDLIGTEREWEVRYLLRGIQNGITT